ncbi:MAG: NAD(P)H-quinone oxidoreductase subunit F [Cyanobacteriota bacterium]|nr:NAD(P)H-quinone oxidoreductase subunit F [Cyanobacteriota bacterium]
MTDFLLANSWFVPLYGAIGAVLTLPWSLGLIRRTGPRPAAYVNLIMTLVAFIHGSIAFRAIWGQPTQQLVLDWFSAADLTIPLTVELSPVSLGALELVTGISLLTQVYALGYLEKDWSLARFYGLMGLFEAALGGIALSDSLFLTYGLLEVLTLSTYLLVGFWYAQPLVVTAARDAFLTKRVGDIILLMGIVALSSYGEGLDFSSLQNWVATAPISTWTATWVGLTLIAGPTGKCAQFPLNLWLDEAMEGPNPAGIMRNSVVVSMGAYVLIKLQPIFILSPVAADVLIILGTVTAIGTSLMAIAQIDIKRTLSHSTSAYLGLVFIAVGLEHVDIAFLILFAHAIGKALIFMSAGSVILTTSNQDITEMGGLGAKMPATTIAFVVGSASLVACLPLGFFWTMQRWLNGSFEIPVWLLAILLFVNALSAINLTRVFRLVFLGPTQPKTRRAPEVPWTMALPMVGLTVVVLVASIAPHLWPLWLSPIAPLDNADLPSIRMAMPLLIASGVLGVVIGSTIELRRSWSRPLQRSLRFLQDLFAYDFYIEKIYEVTVVFAVGFASKVTTWFDRNIVDGAVNFVGLATLFSGQALKYNVSGRSQFYILTIVIGTCLLFVLTRSF